MLSYMKIAWRNLWRNRARTIIITTVVFIVVILATAMTSQQYGMYDNMEENIVDYVGHIQIQDTAYWEKKVMENTLEENDELLKSLEAHDDVEMVTRRMESFALASNGATTKGIAVVGFDPVAENAMANLSNKVIQYRVSEKLFEDIKKDLAEELKDSALNESIENLKFTTHISEERLEKYVNTFYPDVADTIISLIKANGKTTGKYIEENDKGILLGSRIAQYLQVEEGDTVILISQGYRGVSADGLFPVRGVLKIADPKLDRNLIYMEINTCQELYSAYGLLSSYVIKLKPYKDVTEVTEEIKATLPEGITALSWKEMSTEVVQGIESDKAGGYFMKGVFYMIVGFIIFGTVMMMIAERQKEFGIMIAVGMHKSKISIIMFFETLFISLLGVVFGTIVSYPIITLLHHNPIPLQGEMAEMMEDFGYEAAIFFSNSPDMFYVQAIVIFCMTMVITIFPFYSIGKLDVIKALRK